MKKIFALLVALAMLIPMGLVPVANADQIAAQPFYTLVWTDFDEEKFPNLYSQPSSTFSHIGANATISYGGAKIIYNESGLDDATVTAFAENLKKKLNDRPEGARYWHLWAPGEVLRMKPENHIYLDYGVDQMKVLVTAIMAKYKEIGGLLDGIIIDTEYQGMGSYDLSQVSAKVPLVYKQIVDDPRYATEVRPLLEERGFQFYPNPTDYTPEIYSADKKSGDQYELSRNIWNTVMRNRLAQYLNEWAYEPLKTYFPEASMSDYQTTDSKSWLKVQATNDSGEILSGGNSIKAGTASCYSFYFNNPGGDFYKSLSKYASYNDAIYEGTPFNSLLFEINFAKHMYLSNDMRQIAPWVVRYDYVRFKDMDTTVTIMNTPYYAEQIYHLGMLDPEPFMGYFYKPEFKDENGNVSEAVFEDRVGVLNELMAELTKVAGYADRKPIETAPYWNSAYILSGMYAGGRNIWRISPSVDVVSLEDFKVDGASDPTFSAKGQTITFPGGKIIEDAAISHVGSCGYWVETPADVMPVVTNDENRFANYPALQYDFEDVAEGTYDYNNHKPLTAWEFTWKKGATTVIEKVGDNKVLAIHGNAEVRSANLPGNVTAGDTYAENQAWRITVTIPEGMAGDAEIVLLNYVGTKQKTKDGGFKIAGGKIYYSTVGTDADGKTVQEYVELCSVTPGTYVFERVVDFNDPETFYSTYCVYGADGAEIGTSKKVATPTFAAISTIGFSTKNFTDKVLHLDNYKLMVIGLAADFEIYDAATGMVIDKTTVETPRDSATAYRLSWLNAKEETTATVMAAIYQGDTLVEEKVIKEVKMATGYDGVETGVVEVAPGQTVKVYLKMAERAADNVTDDTDAKGGLSIVTIVIIAAAVLVLVALVVILAVAKSKKATPAKPTEEASEE